jgi:hypothetical protein
MGINPLREAIFAEGTIFSPPPGALVAIVPEYPNTKEQRISVTGNSEASYAPPPPMGTGLAQGRAIISLEKCFLQSRFFLIVSNLI